MLIWYLPAVNLILLLPILVIQNEFFCEWCKFFYSVINGFNVKYFIPQNTFSENLEALKAPNFIICQQPWCLQGKTTISGKGVPPPPPPKKKKQQTTKKLDTALPKNTLIFYSLIFQCFTIPSFFRYTQRYKAFLVKYQKVFFALLDVRKFVGEMGGMLGGRDYCY